MKGQKFTLIQAFRGFAALWVVLFHASEGHHLDSIRATAPTWLNSTFFDFGHLGVAVFFAVSGFVIAHSIRGAAVTLRYFGRFALRRSIRLDPPYWASIAFVIAFGVLSSRVKHEPFGGVRTGQVAAHLTYTQEFLRFPEINPVFWTLTYEVQFYVILVLGIMLAQRTRVPPGFLLLVPLIFTAAGWAGVFSVFGLFTNLWPCFLIGAFGYWGIESRAYAAAAYALAVAVLLIHPAQFEVVSIATGLGLLLAGRVGWLETMDWRPVQSLGAISYSLYLTHNPVTGATFFVLSKAHVPELVALGLDLCVCIAVAALFWWVFERPSIQLAHRIKLRN